LSLTKQTGTVGELAVAQKLISCGFQVFFSFGDYSVVDLIALKNNRIVKIQIKTVTDSSDGVVGVIAGKTRGKKNIKYAEGDFDVLVVYVIDRNAVAFIPFAEFNGGRNLSLRFEPPANGQHVGVHYFNDYASL
jgi:hypothetical protein